MIKLKLHWQILLAIVAAATVGSIIDKETAILGIAFYDIFDFIGTLFLNALKMLIVPLITAISILISSEWRLLLILYQR